MRDIEKLKKVQKEIVSVFETLKFKDLHQIENSTGCFKINQLQSIEEPLEFIYCGSEFMKAEEEYIETNKVDFEKLPSYDNEIEKIMSILKIDNLSPEDEQNIRKLLLENQANVIADLQEELYRKWIEETEKRISEIKIDGFEYDCWEEVFIKFKVDGERYEIVASSDEICLEMGGETIEDLEEKQKKEVTLGNSSQK